MVKAMEEQWQETKINDSMLPSYTHMMHLYIKLSGFDTVTPSLQLRKPRSYR